MADGGAAAASRGAAETDQLLENVQQQLDRLVIQLQDCEELREELDDDEYAETREDTLRQMQEFELSLNKMASGNMTLVDSIGKVQLAIQAAVRNAFKTPEVIKMFAKADSDGLRVRGVALRRDRELGKISDDAFNAQMVEVCAALVKLGAELTPEEQHVLDKASNMAAFKEATGAMGEGTTSAVMSIAAAHNEAASQK